MDAIDLHTEQITDIVLHELLKVVPQGTRRGISRAYYRLVGPPTRRFSRVIANFDHIVGEQGMQAAAQTLVPGFMRTFEVYGADHVPASGPLLIVGNHPGSIDLLAYLAGIPRDDMNLVGGHPALLALRNALDNIIYVRPKAVRRKGEVTSMIIERLRDGQGVIIFPRGKMEPDPRWLEGSEESVRHWVSSTNYFAENVPGLQIVPATVSGVIAERALRNPAVSRIRNHKMRQRYALILQILANAMRPHRYPADVTLRFGPVLTREDKGKWLFSAVQTEIQSMMRHHRATQFPLARGVRGWWNGNHDLVE